MKKIFPFICFMLFSFITVGYCKMDKPSYRINPGDTLEISVYNESDLDKTVRVSERGTVSYPLLGEIKVDGLTAEEAGAKIEDLLRQDYLINPQVTVFVKEHTKFSVLGAVNKEGAYELSGPLTLIDAIALAGGAKDTAKKSAIKIIRKEDGKDEEYILDLNTQGGDFFLKGSDRVVVEAHGMISILGEVKNPGSYYIKDRMSVVSAIALAGGFTDLANQNAVRVIREEDGQKKNISVPVGYILRRGDSSRDIFLKEGDTVIAPESLF